MIKRRLTGLTAILACAWILFSCSGWAPVRDAQDESDAPGVYRVRAGDTLIAIAWRYGLDYRQIAAWNNLASPDRILVGQRLRLAPPGVSTNTAAQAGRVNNESQSNTAQIAGSSGQQPSISASTGKKRIKDDVEWRWPLAGRVVHRFRSGALGRNGIGINGSVGQTISAASAGEVVYSGSGLPGYGRLVIVRHSSILLSAYGHLGRILVAEGDRLSSGQKIAELGTNNDQQAVLHFEIRKNGKPVNPLRYLPG